MEHTPFPFNGTSMPENEQSFQFEAEHLQDISLEDDSKIFKKKGLHFVLIHLVVSQRTHRGRGTESDDRSGTACQTCRGSVQSHQRVAARYGPTARDNRKQSKETNESNQFGTS